MSAAPLDILPLEDNAPLAQEAARPASALRQQAAERLAAHRQRRGRQGHSAAQARLDIQMPERKNKIATAVAERYAHSPSYRAFLAEEAQKAIRQAAAAAEVAARSAEAIAQAQHELLAELELWVAPQEFSAETAVLLTPQAVSEIATPHSVDRKDAVSHAIQEPMIQNSIPDAISEWTADSIQGPVARAPRPYAPLKPSLPVKEVSSAGLTVRLYEDLGRTPAPQIAPQALHYVSPSMTNIEQDLDEAEALEDEIAFRQSPVFENYRDPGGSVEPLPANLVEFPRQLVAARKARPRLAEGPLREESPRSPQLRIFEVEPEQISHVPAPASTSPEWSSIRLDAHSLVQEPVFHEDELNALLPSLLPPQTAPMNRRMLAVLVDLTLVLGAFVAFTGAATYLAGECPTGATAGIAAAGTISVFYLLYQALFFTLSDQTPGMRYARIGLCTMTDENPSRSAMRKRIVAILIAACPLGIGLLWMFLDDDRLGWHDRISRMYQRAY